MSPEDLKKLHSAIVGEGSGCLFQPMSEEYTYILTAKHLFFKKKESARGEAIVSEMLDGEVIKIERHSKTENGWEEIEVAFKLQKGTNYFPHRDADIAILKIEYLPGFDNISIHDQIVGEDDYELCGSPDTTRDNNEGERYTTYEVERFITSGNYNHSAQLFGSLNQTNIEGMSGGGILKIVTNHITIVGIQSKMASSTLPAGQIGFVPMKYFNEIVDYPEYAEKLEKLLPLYLGSFSFFKEDIFNLKPGLSEKERAERLTEILKAKALDIQESDITPLTIKDYLHDKLLLLSNQDKGELQKKKIWSIWLELLTILNIAKNNSHCANDLPTIFKKVRLFYSDVDEDFWVKHLDELHKLNYSGLEDTGIVVVASNVKAMNNNEHVLDVSKIPGNITRIKNKFDLERIGPKIDSATDFPLEKYKYMNISAFKENTAVNVVEKFSEESVTNCLETLKELYEQLIPNW